MSKSRWHVQTVAQPQHIFPSSRNCNNSGACRQRPFPQILTRIHAGAAIERAPSDLIVRDKQLTISGPAGEISCLWRGCDFY